MIDPIQPQAFDVALEHAPWYRREAWLAICLASFVPAIVAIYVPRAYQWPLIGLTILAMASSMLMLIRHLGRLRSAERRQLERRGPVRPDTHADE